MEYEVNKNTLAIIPNGNNKCKVLEKRRSYNVNQTSFKVIERACESFGVSYKARLKGSQSYIKSKYKAPIIVEETSSLVFIPISSPKNDTFWINYKSIFDFYPSRGNKRSTIVRFYNGLKMEVPVSYYSFNNQVLKASRLYSCISDRIVRND